MEVIKRLDHFVNSESFAGFDPYDALNTRNFLLERFAKNKIFGLLMIQLLKRSPLNLRIFFGIRKERNPKAIALFLSSYVDLYILTRNESCLRRALSLAEWLLKVNSSGEKEYFAWGYNFPWRSSAFYLPRYHPNMVATVYSGNALLDLASLVSNPIYERAAYKSAEFIIARMLRESQNEVWLSYTPLDNTKVININFMGAYFLARVGTRLNDIRMLELSRDIVDFAVNLQNEDGSWPYSIEPEKSWIDNFHTGFNLEFLLKFQSVTNSWDHEESLRKGFEYFDKNLITEHGIPKYYADKLYPIDIHASAQAVITYTLLKDMFENAERRANQVLSWTIKNMFDRQKKYFYYQKHRHYINKIPYMRWAQAWMFRALSLYLLKAKY